MNTIIQLIENKDVTLVHNTKAPKGCNVGLVRNEAGEVTSFKITYPNGNIFEEKNDYKSRIIKDNSCDWVIVEEQKEEKEIGLVQTPTSTIPILVPAEEKKIEIPITPAPETSATDNSGIPTANISSVPVKTGGVVYYNKK